MNRSGTFAFVLPIVLLLLVIAIVACSRAVRLGPEPPLTTISVPSATPSPTLASPLIKDGNAAGSTALFQVFILSPVHTCIAGNDFYSGNVCRGEKCGDCSCTAEEFDPPAPITGIAPEHINDPQYAGYRYRQCFEISLTGAEIADIKQDMQVIRDAIYEWSGHALSLQLDIRVIPHTYLGFVAPDFVFGPFEVDDELLNPYVTTATDFVYVITGGQDHEQNVQLGYWCGGSYGELSVRGAGYAYIQYQPGCNSVGINGVQVYEPLIHEWMHNLDWALYNVNHVPDRYQYDSPDWAAWNHASWPACGQGDPDPLAWFPSLDFCEWDPDWLDCNNTASAGACIHAGELAGQPSWYQHVISTHYPRQITFNGNYCADGIQDWGETGVDTGWPCP